MNGISDATDSKSRWTAIFWVVVVAEISVIITVSIQLDNTRILASWHGFLHTAIANRFPGPFSVPENPFFAGEALPYYWFYHYVANLFADTLGLDEIHVFQVMTASALVLLWVAAAAVGARHFSSVGVGLLIGFLVLSGVNPLGPVIAIGKSVIQGKQLIEPVPASTEVETVFTDNRQADKLMTQPLLGALYFGEDWRRGQSVPWYLDNSSRGITVALILPFLYFFMEGRASRARLLSIAGVAALMTAFSPLIGLATIGSVFGAAILIVLFQHYYARNDMSKGLTALGFAIAALVGAIAVIPTYYHLFSAGGSGMMLPGLKTIAIKTASLAFNVIVLFPLAVLGCMRATSEIRPHCQMLFIAACALLFVVPLVALPDGTEHNLANVAQCLLVVPAVAAIVTSRIPRWKYAALVLLFLPMTLSSLVSYLARPTIPLSFEHGMLHRTSDEGLEELYDWIRNSTAPRAVFVVDVSKPVKMSGNVSELPAFTRRTLFVDQPSYLTKPNKDFSRRLEISERLTTGSEMRNSDTAYLSALDRPVYLICYEARNPVLANRLTERYGRPLFQKGFIAVHELVGRNTETKD